jgi:hypothetical protein
MFWRTCPGFPDYEISKDGRVRRVTPSKTRKKNIPYELKQRPRSTGGYLEVRLYVGDRSAPHVKAVHRLVCMTFNGSPPPGKRLVRHLDGDMLNNCYKNLAWGNDWDNTQDRIRHIGTFEGERNGKSVLTKDDVIEIRSTFSGNLGETAEMAKRYGVSVSAIKHILAYRSWKHVE